MEKTIPFSPNRGSEVAALRRTCIAALTALFALFLTAHPGAAFQYGTPLPSGAIGVRQPPIGINLTLGPGESVGLVEMTLNGQPVTPQWQPETGMLLYTPSSPLTDGTHTVYLTVQVSAASSERTYRPLVQEFTFFVQGSAVSALPGAHAEGARAVHYLNAIRTAAGLPPVRWDGALGAASAAHATYLIQNPSDRDLNAHGERPGGRGFTGETVGDRTRYWGWTGASVSEVIHFETTAEEGIDGWMESLYHRIPLISADISHIGFQVAGSADAYVQVMNLGGHGTSEATVLWPPPGATEVPPGWSGLEQPDPFRLYDGWQGPVGYTVSATFPGGPGLLMDEMRLTGPDGREVPAYRFTPANDSLLTDTVALIPHDPLAPNTRYEAHFAGTVGGRPWSRTWSFTTGGDMRPILRSWRASFHGSDLREITVTGDQFVPGMRVYLGGLPVRSLSVVSSTSLRFLPPTGFVPGAADLLVVMPSGREQLWHDFFDGTEEFSGGGGGADSPFVTTPFVVDGAGHEVEALRHPDGLLVPESVLTRAGARREEVPATGRVYWHVGGRTADAMPGRARYGIDGLTKVAPLPVRKHVGQLYLPEELVHALLGTPAQAPPEAPALALRDLAGHWAEAEVAQLISTGIVSGYPDGTFRPDEQITRGAFIKMVVAARDLAPAPGNTAGFADAEGHWVAAQGWIGAASAAGIVRLHEYPAGKFEPDRPITREEIAVMVVRALGREADALSSAVTDGRVGNQRFDDVSLWSRPGHVALAIERGIVTGYQEGLTGAYTFRPNREATRAEAAVMLIRMLKAVN